MTKPQRSKPDKTASEKFTGAFTLYLAVAIGVLVADRRRQGSGVRKGEA